MSDRRRSTGSERGQGRRDILAAAQVAFSNKGYMRTSTRDVAELAGINEAMVYRYFGSKSGLFREAAIAPFEQYVSDYVAEWRQRTPGSRPVEIEGGDFIRGLFDVLAEHRKLMVAMLAVREFDQELFDGEDPLADCTRQILDVFHSMLRVELAVRDYRDVDLPVYSRAIFGAVLGMAVHGPWLSSGEDFTKERIIQEIVTTIVHGVQEVTQKGQDARPSFAPMRASSPQYRPVGTIASNTSGTTSSG